MRGKSNGLTVDAQNSQQGLNKDYITQWSYGVDETMTLLIPNFKGGASAGYLSPESETGKKVSSFGVPNAEKFMKEMQLPLYWGAQPRHIGACIYGSNHYISFCTWIFSGGKKVVMVVDTNDSPYFNAFVGTEFHVAH